MLRKTVVTVVGQSWTAVAPDHVIDAYNRPFNFDPNKYSSKPTSHHDLPPATIMAVYNNNIMSGPKIDQVPTLNTLIEDALTARVMSRPVSLFSMSETDEYADTGLLTMKEIEKLRVVGALGGTPPGPVLMQKNRQKMFLHPPASSSAQKNFKLNQSHKPPHFLFLRKNAQKAQRTSFSKFQQIATTHEPDKMFAARHA
jgi:hypothetical protein